MELLVLNQRNATSTRMRKPTVRFSRKSGVINISKSAWEKMELSEKSRLSFCQDKRNPSDWYIRTDDPEGFETRETSSDQHVFNSMTVVNYILDSCSVAKTCAFTIGSEPVEENGVKYWAIITSNRIGEA